MTTDPHDQQSERELEQEVEAVRSAWFGLEKTEPPELLDQAVLNTALRELDSQRKRRPLRWLSAFATATVVVLALTIVIQQDEQTPTPALEKSDGLMLDQAAPVASKKEADRDESEDKAGIEETARRAGPRMKQSAASTAVPASNVAAMAVAEDIPRAPIEAENEAGKIPEAEAWIERLLLLQEARQDEKLLAELAAFREAYPAYPLPPELD